MKRLLFIFLLFSGAASAQTVGQFRYDTTKFLKVGGFNEVKIQNKTMDSLGIFTNVGGGWGQWIRPKAVAGGIKIGNDTILVSGGGGGGGISADSVAYLIDSLAKNFANADLTATGDRYHNFKSYGLTVDSLSILNLRSSYRQDLYNTYSAIDIFGADGGAGLATENDSTSAYITTSIGNSSTDTSSTILLQVNSLRENSGFQGYANQLEIDSKQFHFYTQDDDTLKIKLTGLDSSTANPNNIAWFDSNNILHRGALTTGGGGITSIVPGTNITVDATDPANPIVSSTGGGASGLDSVQLNWSGTLFNTPTNSTTASKTALLSPILASQGAYKLFGRGSGSGTPSFLSSIDSNWVTGLHSEAYYNTKYLSTLGAPWSINGNAGTDTTINFLGTTDSKIFKIKTKNKTRAEFDTLGNVVFGNVGSLAVAYPTYISSGSEYGNNTQGDYRNLKWRLYDAGASSYGIGINTIGIMEFQTGSAGVFGFYPNHVSTPAFKIGISLLESNWPLLFNNGAGKNFIYGYAGTPSQNIGIGMNSNYQLSLFTGNSHNILIGHNVDATNITEANSAAWFRYTGETIIGTGTYEATAKLNVASTTQGVLLPRLTTTQINAIASPANGLTVYCTTESTLCFYNGTSWQKVTTTSL